MKLVVIAGQKAGTEIALPPGETTIGRTPENTIRLTSSTVSRNHAVIVVQNGSCELRDLQSTSGTYVNGDKVAGPTQLANGATIQIGEYAFRLEAQAAAAAAATPGARPIKTGSRAAVAVRQAGAQAARAVQAGARQMPRPDAVPSDVAARAAGKASSRFLGLSWRMQLVLSLGVLGIAALGALGFFFAATQLEFNRYSVSRARLLCKNMAIENGEYLKRSQELQLNVDEVKAEAGVKSTWILDKNLRVIVPQELRGKELKLPVVSKAIANRTVAEGPSPDGFHFIAEPIQVWNSDKAEFEFFGVALLEYAPQEVASALANTARRVVLGLLLLSFAGFISFRLVKRVTATAVAQLQEDTELMLQGQLQSVKARIQWDELVELAASINRVAARQAAPAARSQDAVSKAYGPRPSAVPALPGGGATSPIAESALIAIVGAQPDPTLIVDDSSNIMLMNDHAGELLGIRPDVAKGKHLLEVVKDPELQAVMLDAVSQLTNGDIPQIQLETAVGGQNRTLTASAVRAGNELAAAAVIIR